MLELNSNVNTDYMLMVSSVFILRNSAKPATHAPETGTSRLVPETYARVSVNLVPIFSGTSYLHAIEHSSIPRQKLSGT